MELAQPAKFDVDQLLTTSGASVVLLSTEHVPAELLHQYKHRECDDFCAEE